MHERPAFLSLLIVILIGPGWFFGRPVSFGTTPSKHTTEPRDRPCRLRALKRVGIRVGARVRVQVRVRVGFSSGVGLGWVNVQD